jgi:hypothetical protein
MANDPGLTNDTCIFMGRQPSQINFLADLQGMTAGEACIFHLIQTSLADVAEGGLTLVVLKAVS